MRPGRITIAMALPWHYHRNCCYSAVNVKQEIALQVAHPTPPHPPKQTLATYTHTQSTKKNSLGIMKILSVIFLFIVLSPTIALAIVIILLTQTKTTKLEKTGRIRFVIYKQ